MSTVNDPFMSSRDESMSMVSMQSSVYTPIQVGGEQMTESKIQQVTVVKTDEFYKHGGGAFGN